MKILYFARVRQIVGRGEEEVEIPADVKTVSELIDFLKDRDEGCAAPSPICASSAPPSTRPMCSSTRRLAGRARSPSSRR